MGIQIDTKVTSVIVYPDRARVTSRGHCVLSEGLQEIVIGELPLSMMPDSIRASGRGEARVRIRGVDVRSKHYVEPPSQTINTLEKEIQRVSLELKTLEDHASVTSASIGHLDGLRKETNTYAWGLARGRATVSDQIALLRFFEEEDTRLREERRQVEEEQRTLKDLLAKLGAELAQNRSAQPRRRFEATLEVEALSPGAFEVDLSYVVNNAGWRSLYDMRLNEVDGDVVLSVMNLAEITQNTGQEWKNASLSVSTARPALNQIMPQIQPWFIDEYRAPMPRMLASAAPMMAISARREMAADAEAVDSAPSPPVEAEYDAATIQESGSTVTFNIPGNIDIPGDGTPKKIAVGQNNLLPKLDFLCMPRHTEAAFRRATLVNTTDAPLLPGPINLFVGDEYVGQNNLEYTPKQGEVKLVLGVEDRITVKRELARRDVDKRLLRDQRQLVYGYEIKLDNLLPSRASVVIEDQYPVSRNEQIKIRLDTMVPEATEQTDLHILKWQLELEPGEKKTIRYVFQVEHPRNLVIAGLID